MAQLMALETFANQMHIEYEKRVVKYIKRKFVKLK